MYNSCVHKNMLIVWIPKIWNSQPK